MSNIPQNLLKKETFGAIAELHQVDLWLFSSSEMLSDFEHIFCLRQM